MKVTSADHAPLYDSQTDKRSEDAVSFQAIDKARLPLLAWAGGESYQLEARLIDDRAWLDAFVASGSRFSTYEERHGDRAQETEDRVRPDELAALCRDREAGECLDVSVDFDDWDVGVLVEAWSWQVDRRISPQAYLVEVANPGDLDVMVGDQLVKAGDRVMTNQRLQDIEIAARITPPRRIRCGVERRFYDGVCVATAGLGGCGAPPEKRFGACGLRPPHLEVRLSCAMTATRDAPGFTPSGAFTAQRRSGR